MDYDIPKKKKKKGRIWRDSCPGEVKYDDSDSGFPKDKQSQAERCPLAPNGTLR